MKSLTYGFAMSLSMLAGGANAEVTLTVDGEEYTLSALMANCQTLANDPAAQIACFSAVSKLVEAQAGGETGNVASVPEALEALQAAAQYQTEETGLFLSGTDCKIQVLYYNNYFHISRRNVSSIDVFSATFDAAQLDYEQVSEIRGAAGPLVGGKMDDGATGVMRGGAALESAQFHFAPTPARASIAEYAVEVANQLDVKESQRVEFVLVHPARAAESDDIWNAFEDFMAACRG